MATSVQRTITAKRQGVPINGRPVSVAPMLSGMVSCTPSEGVTSGTAPNGDPLGQFASTIALLPGAPEGLVPVRFTVDGVHVDVDVTVQHDAPAPPVPPSSGTFRSLAPLYTPPTGISFAPTTFDTLGLDVLLDVSTPAFASTVDVPDTGNPVTNGTNLKNAYAAAVTSGGGVRIRLTAGAVYDVGAGLTLTNKGANTNWVTITTIQGGLPVNGVRLASTQANLCATIMCSVAYAKAVDIDSTGAHHVFFEGIIMRPKQGVYVRNIVFLNLDGSLMSDPAKHPHHISFRHCWVKGYSDMEDCDRGLYFDAHHSFFMDGRVTDIQGVGIESQAIHMLNSQGVQRIENNFLSAATETLMPGGDQPAFAGANCPDVVVRRNHFYTPLKWNPRHPTYDGRHRAHKNLLELKKGKRWLIEENVFENCWHDAQNGVAILFKTVNQSNGSDVTSETSDVTFRRNFVVNVLSGFQTAGAPEGVVADVSHRIDSHDNLIVLGDPTLLSQVTPGTENAMSKGAWFTSGGKDQRFRHTTLVGNQHMAVVFAGAELWKGAYRLQDNVLGFGPLFNWGVRGSGEHGSGSFEGYDLVNGYMNATDPTNPGVATIHGNIVWSAGGMSSAVVAAYVGNSTQPNSSLGSIFTAPALPADIANRLVDIAGYTIKAGNPGKGAATDGSDPGCDVVALKARLAGVAE